MTAAQDRQSGDGSLELMVVMSTSADATTGAQSQASFDSGRQAGMTSALRHLTGSVHPRSSRRERIGKRTGVFGGAAAGGGLAVAPRSVRPATGELFDAHRRRGVDCQRHVVAEPPAPDPRRTARAWKGQCLRKAPAGNCCGAPQGALDMPQIGCSTCFGQVTTVFRAVTAGVILSVFRPF